MRNPFSAGTFRWVIKGTYTSGSREGETCVGKWFRDGMTYGSEFFKDDLAITKKAAEIIALFNKSNLIDKKIRLNVPEVWTLMGRSSKLSGSTFLCEPFIKYFQRFNSNTVRTPSSLEFYSALVSR